MTQRGYRMPVNLLTYLEKYSEGHNPGRNVSVVENYTALKAKISEHEELQTFVNNSQDQELKDIALLDIEDVRTDIEQMVESVRDVLGKLSQSDRNTGPGFSLDDDICDSFLLSAGREV